MNFLYNCEKGLVSIVVVHFGRQEVLENCIKSINSQSYIKKELIIINNSSKDIKISLPLNSSNRIINNNQNKFYSYSLNQGIKKSKGEYILVLNNDIILDENYIQKCIDGIKLHPDIGIISGKILSYDRKCIDSAGQVFSVFHKPKERGYKEKNIYKFNKAEFIFGACGAAGFYKKKMLDDIKIENEFFDEDYCMFYEDFDINWRAQNFGWRCFYIPESICYHKRGYSTKTNKKNNSFWNKFYINEISKDLKIHVFKNRYLTIIKNDNLTLFLKHIVFILIYDFFLVMYISITSCFIFKKMYKKRSVFLSALEKRKVIKKRLKNKNLSICK